MEWFELNVTVIVVVYDARGPCRHERQQEHSHRASERY